jgi:hypothetical protein
MKPILFPEHNIVIAKDQPQYQPLPAFAHGSRVICCWSLSWWERLRVLLTGCIWHQIATFEERLQPQLLSVDKPDMQR